LLQKGDAEGAIPEFKTAAQSRPDDGTLPGNLAMAHLQRADFDSAITELEAALKLAPEDASLHYNFGLAYKLKGAAEEAKAGAKITASTNHLQAATFSTNSGKRLLGAGDVDGAIAQFRSAIGSEPNYAAAHYQLGLALIEPGHKDEATQEFQKARALILIRQCRGKRMRRKQ
jgi:Flp pilus assembly protein TadD